METKDFEWEHIMHNTYQENCSECYSENRIIKAHKTVNKPEVYEKNLSRGWSHFINNLGKKNE